jgi:hypothetical protein
MTGKKAEARKVLAVLDEQSRKRQIRPLCFILIYLGLGDKDRTFEWMERCFKEYPVDLNGIKVAAGFDSLRSDPRFTDLLRRMRFPD